MHGVGVRLDVRKIPRLNITEKTAKRVLVLVVKIGVCFFGVLGDGVSPRLSESLSVIV